MPTIPDFQPSQRQEPVPGVRVNEEAPLSAFGGGGAVAAATQAAGDLANDATRIQAQKEDKDRADADAAVLSAKRRAMNEWEYKNVYDPKTGALSKMGANSFGTTDQLKTGFDKFVEEQGKDLTTDRQRKGYIELAEARRDHILRTSLDHVDKQTHVVEQSELLAGMESSKDRAATDPTTVPTELAIIRSNVMAQRDSLGWKDNETALELKKQQSDLHARVVRRLSTDGRDLEAKKYFDDHANDMTTQDYDRSEEFVKNSSTLGESQRQATSIMMPYLDESGDKPQIAVRDEEAALAQARKIKDPRTQEKTVDLIKERFQEKKRIDQENYLQNAQAASDIVEQYGTTDKIPLDLRKSLKRTDLSALDARAAQIRKKEEPVTDWGEYTKLRDMAADPETRQEFLKIPPMNYRAYLGNTEFKEIVGNREGLLKGDDKTIAKMKGYRTIAGIVDGTLAQSDFSDDKEAREAIERIMDEEVKVEQTRLHGENPDNQWVQDKIDKLVTKAVTEPGWLYDSKEYGYKTSADYLKGVEKIPAANRQLIEEALRKKGIVPTRRRVIELYTEGEARKQAGATDSPSRATFMTGGKK